MADIFISYRHGHRDTWAVRSIARTLDEPYRPFYDRDSRSIDHGDNVPRKIEDTLRRCRVFCTVIGPDWCSSEGSSDCIAPTIVRREIRTALERPEVRVIPLLIEPAAWPTVDVLPTDIRRLLDDDFFE
jgi:hypothetical protein